MGDKNITAKVHSFESFGAVDGPGVRFVVFLQGCSMRCLYCHNPETWDKNKGSEYTPEEIFEKAEKYSSYWGDDGGITVSGGEPLLQIDFLTEFFKLCRENGVNTCIDTSLQPFTREEPYFSKFKNLMNYTDLLLCDIKHIDPEIHLNLTGKKNDNIISCFRYLDEIDKPIWIRHVLVPKITDDDIYLKKTAEFIKSLSNVKKIEVLPYHTLGIPEYEKLKIPYRLKGVEPPDSDRVKNAIKILSSGVSSL